MLKVEDYARIRKLVIREGVSIRQAARQTGHSRKSIRKALERAEPRDYERSKPPARPVLGPFTHIIDEWLDGDTKRRKGKKQRHTAKRIWERLNDEYDFKGSVSAVRRYVRFRKQTGGEVFYPLQFDPGEEAQVDWGEAWCVINGEERKVNLFCYRLCHSGASFVRAYERQNQESLLDGHVRAFEFFGGVSRRLAYDNLRAVVITVKQGRERVLTKRFLALESHYLFDHRFCNIARGNEKGHVENLVKLSQRSFMTPLPEVSSLEELNQLLEQRCRAYLDQVEQRSGKTRRELLEEEKQRMIELPASRFDACRKASTFASKQSLVRFDCNDYSVPVAYAHHPVVIKGFVDRVELYSAHELIASHPRSYGKLQFILDPYHYIPLLESKPGGIHNARPFKGEPWGEDFTRLRTELEWRYEGEGTRKFIKVLLMFSEFPVADVKQAVHQCVRRRAFSDEAVRSVITFEPRRDTGLLDLSAYPELQLEGDGCRSASVYDVLLGREVTA